MAGVEATSAAVNVAKAKESTSSRLARLEDAVGKHQGALEGISETMEDVSVRVKGMSERIEALEEGMNDLVRQEIQGMFNALASSLNEELIKRMDDKVNALVQSLKGQLDELRAEVAVCKAAVAGSATLGKASTRIKVPEPPKFNGSRDAKEIDNFLWCVERYFDALSVEEDATKITTTSMYLVDDAILWWRRRQADEKKGLCHIRTWDEFKGDFKKQFYPENAEEVALKKLRALRHTSTVKEYVKQFSSTMLEVSCMPEDLLLIYFMDGLQRWAEQELKRRNVKTLNEAIAAAESLYEVTSDRRRGKEADNSSNEYGGGDHQSSTIRGDGTRTKEAATRDQSRTQGRDKGRSFNCFLCGGPHMVRECPQRQKLNAMLLSHGDEESEKAHEPRRLGAMRLLNAGVVDKPTGLATATDVEPTLKATGMVEPTLKATEVTSKEPAGLNAMTKCEVEPTLKATRRVEPTLKATEGTCEAARTNVEAGRKYKGNLLTVNGEVNGVRSRVLVDSGATHNYVALRVARDMDIRYTKTEEGKLKAVNSSATPIYGTAYGVPLRLGKWKGKAKFMVVDIDDEDVVLGMEFIDAVRPFMVGDGVLQFTSNGNEFAVELVQQQGDDARIASLRVLKTPRRRRQRRDGGWTRPPMHRVHDAGVPSAGQNRGSSKSGHRAPIPRDKDADGPRKRVGRVDRDGDVHGLGGGECHGWHYPKASCWSWAGLGTHPLLI